jgi:outer membrane lipoprotein-sorting protein
MSRVSYRAALVVVLSLLATAAGAQTVDEVVAKNLQSKGGAEKWKTVTSVKMTGTIQAQGQDMPLTVYARRPNNTRQEIQVNGQTLVQAFDGTRAWIINPMLGAKVPQEMPPEISSMMANSSDFEGPLVNYKEKGNTVELIGREKLDAGEAYHLKVTHKGGQAQHYYLDVNSGVELKKTEEVAVGAGGVKQTLETRMSDYRAVDGVQMAHTVNQMIDGKPVATISLKSVELNAAVDPSLFSMPAK